MKYSSLFSNASSTHNIPSEDLAAMMNAIMSVYPMVVLSNLTKNQYCLIRNEGFLYNDILESGIYDDLIDNNVENIHENYQATFLKCFSRENLLREFASGKTDVYAELYQKDTSGAFRWVSTHVIRVHDDSGDIIQICFNRLLDKIVEKHHGHF